MPRANHQTGWVLKLGIFAVRQGQVMTGSAASAFVTSCLLSCLLLISVDSRSVVLTGAHFQAMRFTIPAWSLCTWCVVCCAERDMSKGFPYPPDTRPAGCRKYKRCGAAFYFNMRVQIESNWRVNAFYNWAYNTIPYYTHAYAPCDQLSWLITQVDYNFTSNVLGSQRLKNGNNRKHTFEEIHEHTLIGYEQAAPWQERLL